MTSARFCGQTGVAAPELHDSGGILPVRCLIPERHNGGTWTLRSLTAFAVSKLALTPGSSVLLRRKMSSSASELLNSDDLVEIWLLGFPELEELEAYKVASSHKPTQLNGGVMQLQVNKSTVLLQICGYSSSPSTRSYLAKYAGPRDAFGNLLPPGFVSGGASGAGGASGSGGAGEENEASSTADDAAPETAPETEGEAQGEAESEVARETAGETAGGLRRSALCGAAQRRHVQPTRRARVASAQFRAFRLSCKRSAAAAKSQTRSRTADRFLLFSGLIYLLKGPSRLHTPVIRHALCSGIIFLFFGTGIF